MGIVLLGERVLGEPATGGGVVAAGAEVVEVQALRCTPFLALVLHRLDACGRGVLRDRPAEGIVVVVLLRRAAGRCHHAHGAQVVCEEVVIGVVRQGHVSAVEQQARAGAVLQHQVPGVVRRGCRTGCRPCLAELRAIGGVAVVDHRPAAEGHQGQSTQVVVPEGIGFGLRDAVVLPDHLCAILSPVQRETNV